MVIRVVPEERRTIPTVAPKPKVEVAREHLDKAQEEAMAGDSRDAVQWGFASLEAAIDALAAGEGIAIEEKHWKRSEAAAELHRREVLPSDLSGLHKELNVLRKAIFYDGEELESEGFSVEDALVEIETAVEIAEAKAR
jgi:DNA-binding transcriptional LysR family regulator